MNVNLTGNGILRDPNGKAWSGALKGWHVRGGGAIPILSNAEKEDPSPPMAVWVEKPRAICHKHPRKMRRLDAEAVWYF